MNGAMLLVPISLRCTWRGNASNGNRWPALWRDSEHTLAQRGLINKRRRIVMQAASIMDISHVLEMSIEQAIVCAARYLNMSKRTRTKPSDCHWRSNWRISVHNRKLWRTMMSIFVYVDKLCKRSYGGWRPQLPCCRYASGGLTWPTNATWDWGTSRVGSKAFCIQWLFEFVSLTIRFFRMYGHLSLFLFASCCHTICSLEHMQEIPVFIN